MCVIWLRWQYHQMKSVSKQLASQQLSNYKWRTSLNMLVLHLVICGIASLGYSAVQCKHLASAYQLRKHLLTTEEEARNIVIINTTIKSTVADDAGHLKSTDKHVNEQIQTNEQMQINKRNSQWHVNIQKKVRFIPRLAAMQPRCELWTTVEYQRELLEVSADVCTGTPSADVQTTQPDGTNTHQTTNNTPDSPAMQQNTQTARKKTLYTFTTEVLLFCGDSKLLLAQNSFWSPNNLWHNSPRSQIIKKE